VLKITVSLLVEFPEVVETGVSYSFFSKEHFPQLLQSFFSFLSFFSHCFSFVLPPVSGRSVPQDFSSFAELFSQQDFFSTFASFSGLHIQLCMSTAKETALNENSNSKATAVLKFQYLRKYFFTCYKNTYILVLMSMHTKKSDLLYKTKHRIFHRVKIFPFFCRKTRFPAQTSEKLFRRAQLFPHLRKINRVIIVLFNNNSPVLYTPE